MHQVVTAEGHDALLQIGKTLRASYAKVGRCRWALTKAQLTAHSIFQAQVEKELPLCGKGFFAVPNGLINKINFSLPDRLTAPIEDQARS